MDRVVEVIGPFRRIFITEGGKGSGHHGHEGREGEVGGSEPGAGGPKKGKAGGRRGPPRAKQFEVGPEEVEEEVVGDEFDELPLMPEVYGQMEVGGEEIFEFNEDLETTGLIPIEDRRAFLMSLPADTREMTLAQRFDLVKTFLDMDRDKFNEMHATNAKMMGGLHARMRDDVDARYKWTTLLGVTEVMSAAHGWVGQMAAAQEALNSDDPQRQAFGKSLSSAAVSHFNSSMLGIHNWPEADRQRYYEASTSGQELDLYAFVSGGGDEAPVEVKGFMRRISIRGGEGSGFFEHAGREGEVGGSQPGGGVKAKPSPRGQTDPPPAADEDSELESGIIKKIGDVEVRFESEEQFQQIKGIAEDHVGVSEQAEAELSQMMMLLAEQHGGEMVKIEHATKSVNAMIRKIRLDMLAEGLDADTAAALINDGNRYTMTFEPEDFTERVLAVQDTLKEQGWEQYDQKWKNFFQTGDAYDGYNTVMWNPETGQKYELQYHTTQSVQIKDVAHEIYTRMKALGSDQRFERISLWNQMTDLWQEGAEYAKPKNWWLLPGAML